MMVRTRPVNRKAQIVEEATQLFSRYGFDKVTIKQLADSIGITEPGLYRHYPSKEAIYDAVIDSLEDRLEHEALFERLEDESDLEILLTSVAGQIIDFYNRNADVYRIMLYAALREHQKAVAIYQLIRGAYVKFLIRQFDRLYNEGVIVKKRNDITARCFVGMVFDCALGTTLWRGMQGREYKPAEVIANNVPIYVRGLKA